MEANCYKKGCKRFASYYCITCKPIQKFCGECLLKHLNHNPGHKTPEEYIDIDPNKLEKIILSKYKFIKDLNEVFKSIIDQYTGFIKNIKKILNVLGYIKSTYLLIFKDALTSEKLHYCDFNMLESLEIIDEYKKVLAPGNTMEEISKIFPHFDWFVKVQNYIGNLEMKIELFGYLPTDPNSDSKEEEEEDKFWIFYPNGKNIRVLDIESSKIHSKSFNNQVDFRVLSSACKIKKNTFFYNIENKNYLLNFLNNTAQELPAFDSSLVGRGCAAKNKTVYLFGGFTDNSSSKDCYKIELGNKNWTSIAPLPNPSKFNSASNINNNLYVVGYNLESLLFYDDIRNNFKPVQKISPELKIFCDNWIIINSESYVLEIKDGRPTKHKLDRKSCISTLVVSCSFRNDRYIYFVEQESKIHRFDTQEKVFKKIK